MPRAKRMTEAQLFAEGERLLAQDQSENIRLGERVKKLPNPNPPITIRMTPILVGKLDRLATAQHRKRTNLIQHVLWEYVFAQEAAAPHDSTAAPAKAMVARAKKSGRPKTARSVAALNRKHQ